MLRGKRVEKTWGIKVQWSCRHAERDGDNVLYVLRVQNFKFHEVEKSTNMHLQIYENICNTELFKQIVDVDGRCRCRCVVYHASQLERTVKPQT